MQRLETNPGQEIVDVLRVLRVSYERLPENEQTLFLHIAVFFNNINGDFMKTMFADSNLDVNYGLKILENRSLISTYGDQIVMHKLLQQVGKIAIHEQDPLTRQILIDADEICYVLEEAKGTRAVSGISFDISNIDEVSLSKKAFKRMPNLRFLRIYKSRENGNYRMQIPEEMEFPRRLRLLDWKAYPRKCLPPTFNPEYLVELHMRGSQLEKLWEGIQPLTNLKKMDLSESYHLKELPDLSNATNMEELNLKSCESLVEIPSSFSHLHKLKILCMIRCINLQVIPARMNLASLETVFMSGCTRLRNIPVMSTNIIRLSITVEDVPPSIRLFSLLWTVSLSGSGKLKGFTHPLKSVIILNLSLSDIERIPDCFKALHNLLSLDLGNCRRLTSLPELPCSLQFLNALNCESLETLFGLPPSSNPFIDINFTNCIKLGQQAQRWIIRRSLCCNRKTVITRRGVNQRSFCYKQTILPGREVPEEFDNRARGSSLTIVLDGNRSYSGFVFCVVFSRCNQPIPKCRYSEISWRPIIAQGDGYPVEGCVEVDIFGEYRTEHLLIYYYHFREIYRPEVNREMMFEFSSEYNLKSIECGVKIIEWSYESGSDQASKDDIEFEPSEEASGSGSAQASKDDIEFEPSEETSGSGSDQIHIIAKRVHHGLEFEPSEEAFEAWKKRRKLCFEEKDDRKKSDIEFEPSEEAFEDWKKRRKLCFEEEDDRKKARS